MLQLGWMKSSHLNQLVLVEWPLSIFDNLVILNTSDKFYMDFWVSSTIYSFLEWWNVSLDFYFNQCWIESIARIVVGKISWKRLERINAWEYWILSEFSHLTSQIYFFIFFFYVFHQAQGVTSENSQVSDFFLGFGRWNWEQRFSVALLSLWPTPVGIGRGRDPALSPCSVEGLRPRPFYGSPWISMWKCWEK